MKKIYTITICFVFALNCKSQQDPQFNLYQFNQMVINPAYAGARDGIAVVGSARQQWSGFDGAPRTSCMSVHAPVFNKKLGVGLTVINDVMGPRNMFAAYGNVAYILKLSDKLKLSAGINAGYNRYQFDFNKLTFKTAEVNTEILQTQTKGILDINSGLYLRSNKFFAGLSLTHMTGPSVYNYSSQNSELNYRLRTHMFFNIGRSFQFNENVIFAPTIMLKASATASGDINLNFFLYKKLWLGVFVRGDYGPGFLMQFNVTHKFRIGYSYDTGLNDARKLGATHEVIIGFDFSEKKSKIISPRFL